MRNLQSLILPGIVIGLIGGIILFFAAYNYYPQKNVNININGDCFEFLDRAYSEYQLLESEKQKELLKLQLDAIGPIIASIPITFSGSTNEVDKIINSYQINVTNRQLLGDNFTQIDKVIIRGIVDLSVLEQISAGNLQKNKSGSFSSIESAEIGILPNSFISSSESMKIRDNMDNFMIHGIKQIINSSTGVKPTECRSAIVYQDS